MGVIIATLFATLTQAACPTRADLAYGILFSFPTKNTTLTRRHRALQGPYIGETFVNGLFDDTQTVTYAGLFTYKYFSRGKLIQFEEPQNDISALLNFESGSEHPFQSVRYNPQRPEKRWLVDATFKIEQANDFSIDGCRYKAVNITETIALTRPDKSVHNSTETYTFLPELFLKVAGKDYRYGDVSFIRKRRFFDGKDWPFSKDPVANLLD